MNLEDIIFFELPKNPNPKMINATGRKFGEFLVYSFLGIDTSRGQRKAMWLCRCSCGEWRIKSYAALQHPKVRSCGCIKAVLNPYTTHGEARHTGTGRTPEYNAYKSAKARCNSPSPQAFHNYGGRGIEFRFQSYEEFLECVGRKPTPKHSLERIDVNGHYERGNVKWATLSEQKRNQRRNRNLTALGKTQCLKDWALELHMYDSSLLKRIRKGWCDKCIVTIPRYAGTCPHRQ